MPLSYPNSSVASLHSRIRQLEADNASLSHAASEAASLVEEYAADAAAYRRSQPANDALVTELTDAARRKDLRIQRLTSMLEAERARSEQMENKVQELEEMLRIADEMEKTLRLSLEVVQKEKIVCLQKDGVEDAQVWNLALEGFRQCMPEGLVREEFESLQALKEGMEALNLAKQLINSISGSLFKWERGFTRVVQEGCVSLERALKWCFAEPATRGVLVLAEVSNWKARLEKVIEAVGDSDAIRWTDEFANMKEGLLRMAVETLEGIVPKGYVAVVSEGTDALLRDIEESWRSRAAEVRRELRLVRHGIDKSCDGISMQKKLDVTQNTLSRRTKELEDVKVRMQVFEERLEEAVEEGKQLTACKKRIAELEMRHSNETVAATETLGEDSPEKSGGSRERSQALGYQGAHRLYEDAEGRNETTRLRQVLVRRHLADLQPHAPRTDSELHKILGKETGYCKSMYNTIEDARLFASNASIVDLDPAVLSPTEHKKSRQRETQTKDGTSTNEILYNNREENARDVHRQEIILDPARQDLSGIITALRLSFLH